MSETRRPRLGKWQPKKWRPEYEKIVGLSCLGWSNKKIAAEVGFTKEYVSVILNLDAADELREMILAKMREKNISTITENMDYVANKTLQLMRKAVDSEELFEKSPFALINMGLEAVKGLGHLRKGEAGGVNVEKAIILTGSITDTLTEGLQKANEVMKLNAGPEST